MAIDISFHYHFSDLSFEGETPVFKSDLTLWEVRQRAYYFGQKITTERIEMRSAYMSAIHQTHTKEEDLENEDKYYIEQMKIGLQLIRPIDDYMKQRRKLLKDGKTK